MKTILIQYRLKEAANVQELEARVAVFVAGVRDLAVGVRYLSNRKKNVPRSYAHLGFIPSEEALAALQSAPFFKDFATYLPTVCEEPPQSTWLETVASTDL